MELPYHRQGSIRSPTNNTASGSSSQNKFLKRSEDLSSSPSSQGFDRHQEDETRSPPTGQAITPSSNACKNVLGDKFERQKPQQQEPEPYQQPETPYRRRGIFAQATNTEAATRPRETDSNSPRHLTYQIRRQFNNGTIDAVTTSSRSATSISILPVSSSSKTLSTSSTSTLDTTSTPTTSASSQVTLSLLPPAGGGNSTGTGPTTTITIITGPPPSNAPSAATSPDERMSANLVLVVTFCAVFGAVLLIGTGIFLWKRARRRAERVRAKGGKGGGGGGGVRGKRKYDGPAGSLYGDDPYATAAGEMENGPVWGVTPPWAVADLPLAPSTIVLPPDPNRRMTLPGTMSRTLPKIVAQRVSPTGSSASNYPPSRSASSAYSPPRGRTARAEVYDPSNVI